MRGRAFPIHEIHGRLLLTLSLLLGLAPAVGADGWTVTLPAGASGVWRVR